MRSFILGIAIVMAAPAYSMGQQRDRRAEPRSEIQTPSPRQQRSDVAPPSRVGRYTPSPAEMVRGRLRGQLTQAAPARTRWVKSPRIPEAPSFIARPTRGLRQLPNHGHRRSAQDYRVHRPHYRHPHTGANVVFVPYAAPVAVEREVVIQRNETAGAPVIVEQPLLARLILDVHPT